MSTSEKKILETEERLSTETWLDKFTEEFNAFKKERIKFFDEARTIMQNQRSIMATFLAKSDTAHRKTDKELLKMHKQLLKYNEIIDAVAKTNACVDESLCNVLLAIRQNEYLQAYYPAQAGYPEMKVTGMHPANIEE